MRIGLIADVHFKASEPWGRINPTTGINTRLQVKLDIFRSALQRCYADKVDLIVLLGDIFDTYNPPDWLRAKVSDVIGERVKDSTIIYVPGNHDANLVGVFESEGALAGNILGKYEDRYRGPFAPGFYYVAKPAFIDWNGLGLQFVPYFDRMKLRTLYKAEKIDVFFSHFFLSGARISDSNMPLALKGSGIPIALVEEYPLGFLGDIHIPQTIPCTKFGVHYPGQLTKIQFKDAKDPGFIIAEIATCEELDAYRYYGDQNSATPIQSIASVDIRRVSTQDWEADEFVIEEGTDLNECLDSLCNTYNTNGKVVTDDIRFVLKIWIKGSLTFINTFPKAQWRNKLLSQMIERVWFDTVLVQSPDSSIQETSFKGSLSARFQQFCNAKGYNEASAKLVTIKLEELSQ